MPSFRAQTLKVVLLLFCVHASLACAVETKIGVTGEQAAVTAVIGKFASAWNSHDIEALTHLFTPDGKFKSPAGQGAQTRRGIRELLAQEHREIFRESTLAATTGKIGFPEAGVAIATGSYTLSGIPVLFGIEVERAGSSEFRLVRRHGRWLIASARIARE